MVGDKKSKNNGLKEHGSSPKQSLGIATDNILCGAYIKQCVCGFTVLHVDFFTCVEKSQTTMRMYIGYKSKKKKIETEKL